eukprot:SAG31_NODE_1383_length_8578_cov_3.660573_7_plen_53_part_00
MSMVMYENKESLVGACCWRADGTAVGIGGGYAMPGARFSTGAAVERRSTPKL